MMVINVPIKFEFNWTNLFRVRVRKQKCGRTDGWTDKRTKNRQTNGRNYTNFELESGNGNFDRQTDKRQTNKWTELHQFRKEPSYDGDLCPCEV